MKIPVWKQAFERVALDPLVKKSYAERVSRLRQFFSEMSAGLDEFEKEIDSLYTLEHVEDQWKTSAVLYSVDNIEMHAELCAKAVKNATQSIEYLARKNKRKPREEQ